MKCPKCGSNDISKRGFSKNKDQAYKCRDCGRVFVNTKKSESYRIRDEHPDINGKRYCIKCEQYLDVLCFYKSKNGSYQSYCKSCNSVRNKVNKYDIDSSALSVMLISQNNKCAICGIDIAKSPCIDHSHDTGRVRGLLCLKCNSGIGMFNDNIDSLGSAIKYLIENLEN